MTMRQKVDVLIFFNISPKGQFWEKLKFDHSLVFSWALLVFTSFFSRCGLQIFSNNFYKNERFNLYMFNVIYM